MRWSKSLKPSQKFDCRPNPACMKLESLVIADQHAAVNTSRAQHTGPSHHESLEHLKSSLTARRARLKVGLSNWGGKSYYSSQHRKAAWLDHLSF